LHRESEATPTKNGCSEPLQKSAVVKTLERAGASFRYASSLQLDAPKKYFPTSAKSPFPPTRQLILVDMPSALPYELSTVGRYFSQIPQWCFVCWTLQLTTEHFAELLDDLLGRHVFKH
jgi:hypothetical protein